MSEVSFSLSGILKLMAEGAKLHRGFGDRIELRVPESGTAIVPIETFDSLIDQNKIEAKADGFYERKP